MSELVISARTVETYVQHVVGKPGFGPRRKGRLVSHPAACTLITGPAHLAGEVQAADLRPQVPAAARPLKISGGIRESPDAGPAAGRQSRR